MAYNLLPPQKTKAYGKKWSQIPNRHKIRNSFNWQYDESKSFEILCHLQYNITKEWVNSNYCNLQEQRKTKDNRRNFINHTNGGKKTGGNSQ